MLWSLAHHALQLPANQQIEHLVGAAELYIGLDGNGVVGLQQRVEQFRDGDGFLVGEPGGKVGPLQELSHSEHAGQFKDVGQAELPEPLTLVDHFSPVLVHHLEELTEIGLSVLQDLLVGQHGPGG